jgi:5-methylcytosine-specific restriction endonuclease McrA
MRSLVSKRVRRSVLERDKFHCQYCGCPHLTLDDGTVDHIVPVALGGHHKEDNLRTACRPCNSRRGSKSLEEFRFLLVLVAAGLQGVLTPNQAIALQERGIDLHLPAPQAFYFERAIP